MTDRLHILPKHRTILESLLEEHLPDVEVWAYGSRVNGRSHDGSDMDLVLRAPGLNEIPAHQVSEFKDAVRASAIPFLVEARDWAKLPERFHREIEKRHIVLEVGEGLTASVTRSAELLEWKQINLGRVCFKIGSGATPRGGKDAYMSSGPYALIRSQNVFNNGFRTEGLAYIGELQATKLKSVEVARDDVLLNITGDSVARVCQVRSDILPARVNQHVAIIRPNPFELDPRFLRYALVAPDMQDKLLSWAGSGGTRNALTKGMIESLDVAIPPNVQEQHAIAHILGTLDDKIDLNRRMNETLEAMARAAFKDWFVDFGPTRAKAEGRARYLPAELWNMFPGSLDDDDKPMGWEQGTLADVADSPRHGVSPADVPNNTPYIGLEHMPRRSIALSEWGDASRVSSNKTRFSKGDVLFGKLRPYFHKVGVAPIDGICSTDIVVVTPRAQKWRAFALACLSADEFVDYTNRTSTGTRMPRTNWKTMAQYEICLPSAQVVSAFQELVQPLIDGVDANVHENSILAKTRNLLLPKLISGEIRIQNAENAVEAVEAVT